MVPDTIKQTARCYVIVSGGCEEISERAPFEQQRERGNPVES
jgi:hypothetical protein